MDDGKPIPARDLTGRVDYAWSQRWVLDPAKIDPKTKMTMQGLTPEQQRGAGVAGAR